MLANKAQPFFKATAAIVIFCFAVAGGANYFLYRDRLNPTNEAVMSLISAVDSGEMDFGRVERIQLVGTRRKTGVGPAECNVTYEYLVYEVNAVRPRKILVSGNDGKGGWYLGICRR